MADLNEIKKQLDDLYNEYKENKSQLNGGQTQKAADLLVKMTASAESSVSMMGNELSRFSADVCNLYFNSFTKTVKPSVEVIDELISAFIATDTNKSKSQFYIQKYIYIVTAVIKNRNEVALVSKQLPKLVNNIARSAMTSEKYRKKFQTLVNSSNGVIYLLDFTGTNENSLKNIWNITKILYPDLSKAKYEDYIKEWAEKYGFIDSKSAKAEKETEKKNNTAIKEESVTAHDELKSAPKTETTEKNNTEKVTSTPENPVSPEKNVTENYVLSATQNLYTEIHKEITAETENVKSAINDAVFPLQETMKNFQQELNKCLELTTTNMHLQIKIAELEQQVKEANQCVYVDENSKTAMEEKIQELDEKLKEAYSLNSREASLEAERIKNDISKSLTFCYEDWLEYEFSEYSKENYESLQAMIKRIFRALEKNGINFKGNNE